MSILLKPLDVAFPISWMIWPPTCQKIWTNFRSPERIQNKREHIPNDEPQNVSKLHCCFWCFVKILVHLPFRSWDNSLQTLRLWILQFGTQSLWQFPYHHKQNQNKLLLQRVHLQCCYVVLLPTMVLLTLIFSHIVVGYFLALVWRQMLCSGEFREPAQSLATSGS